MNEVYRILREPSRSYHIIVAGLPLKEARIEVDASLTSGA